MHWEVNKKASFVLHGTDELLKGQLYNKQTRLMDKRIAELFIIVRLNSLLFPSSYIGNMPIIELRYAAMHVLSQVTEADKYFNTLTPVKRQDGIGGYHLASR